jgi:6-pyruvoyl-tetrahydropterin synthase
MKSGLTRYLDTDKIRIYRDEDGELKLRNSRDYTIKKAMRSFPLTHPWRYIAFLDEKDNEIGIIENVNELEKASREVLKDELERTYFVPVITKINEIKEEFGIFIWKTETDRGPRTFEVAHRERVKKAGNHFFIKDADGNLYKIDNVENLDEHSKGLIDI